ASTLNSSGGVVRSRSPRRLSATSGWLLTFSGTIVLDKAPDRVHCDLQHAVHVGRVEVVDFAGAQLIHTEVDRCRTQLSHTRDHKEGRGFHVIAQYARARPHLQLVAQVRP